MKIIFFTQDDPFYVKIFFDEFLKNYKSPDEIRAIVISRSMGQKSTYKLAKQMFDFYGPVNFLRMGFRYTFLKLMSKKQIKKSDSGKIPKTYSIKQTAGAYGVNVIERSDLNSKGFISFIQKYDADLFISVASPIIFKEALINIPKLDCINIHNAPLPRYRGMLPNFWQLYHGEKKVGITVHRIETGIDTGDIISQHYVPIEPDETLDHLIRKTKKENAKLIINTIEAFRNANIQYRKISDEGSYYSFPTRKDVKKFKRRGKRII